MSENDIIKAIWNTKPTKWFTRDLGVILEDFIKANKSEEELKQLLTTGRVLDIGSGMGCLVNDCLALGYDIYGIDLAYINPEVMERVSHEEQKTIPDNLERFIAGDAISLPFPDAYFHFIINLCGPLTWASSKDKFSRMIEEEWRVLEPGGVIFISQILQSESGLFVENARDYEGHHHLKHFIELKNKIRKIQLEVFVINSVKFYFDDEDMYGYRVPAGFALLTKLAN